MKTYAEVGRIERQFIIDNPHLRSNAIQKFIDVSTTHINRIKQETHGKIRWFHNGNKYPYLNAYNGQYQVRYAGNPVGKTYDKLTAFNLIDTMISAIDSGFFDSGRIPKPKSHDVLKIKLPPAMQIARKSDYK